MEYAEVSDKNFKNKSQPTQKNTQAEMKVTEHPNDGEITAQGQIGVKAVVPKAISTLKVGADTNGIDDKDSNSELKVVIDIDGGLDAIEDTGFRRLKAGPKENQNDEGNEAEENEQGEEQRPNEAEERAVIQAPNVRISIGGFSGEYNKNGLIEEVINDYKNSIPELRNVGNSIIWKINETPFELQTPIYQFLEDENQAEVNLNINYEILLLKNYSGNYTASQSNINLIGQPLCNPFEVFIYSKNEKIFKLADISEQQIDSNYLNYYSFASGYCNGNNKLFISGGEIETNKELIGLFWTIDLQDFSIEVDPSALTNGKKNHSMIYIPDSYVFIVGGNSKEVYFYDLESKRANDWAPLQSIRFEPSLCLINERYLFAFDNVRVDPNIPLTIEVTDLLSSPNWYVYTPQVDEQFTQKFFGVLPIENEKILFLGGEMSKNNEVPDDQLFNFEYVVSSNTIQKSEIPFKHLNLQEKTFIPFSSSHAFIANTENRQCPSIAICSIKKNKLRVISFDINPEDKDYFIKNMDATLLNSVRLSASQCPKMHKYDFNMPNLEELQNKQFLLSSKNNNLPSIPEDNDDKNLLDLQNGNLNVIAEEPNLDGQLDANEDLNLKQQNIEELDANIVGELNEDPVKLHAGKKGKVTFGIGESYIRNPGEPDDMGKSHFKNINMKNSSRVRNSSLRRNVSQIKKIDKSKKKMVSSQVKKSGIFNKNSELNNLKSMCSTRKTRTKLKLGNKSQMIPQSNGNLKSQIPNTYAEANVNVDVNNNAYANANVDAYGNYNADELANANVGLTSDANIGLSTDVNYGNTGANYGLTSDANINADINPEANIGLNIGDNMGGGLQGGLDVNAGLEGNGGVILEGQFTNTGN